MSDEAAHPIDGEAIARFFLSRGIKGECPTCQTTNWTIASEDSEQTLFSIGSYKKASPGDPGPTSIPLLVLVCNNCFTVRQHALAGLLRWLNDDIANPPQSKVDGDNG